MPKYKVWARTTECLYLIVDARDKEHAEEIADNTDGGDFTSVENASWDIDYSLTEELGVQDA